MSSDPLHRHLRSADQIGVESESDEAILDVITSFCDAVITGPDLCWKNNLHKNAHRA